ncbi:hypothetical protein E2C01_096140 [Portunus trituberculatus]|uniref:Uncharacterized protein n=1 Tax=Portunus trituberculatus TaxID=210409 RepID=A0A5B7JRX0_PORTR|nr:hypothetical protein [Portunus trituberculatus]
MAGVSGLVGTSAGVSDADPEVSSWTTSNRGPASSGPSGREVAVSKAAVSTGLVYSAAGVPVLAGTSAGISDDDPEVSKPGAITACS